jgi:hypothetical protein
LSTSAAVRYDDARDDRDQRERHADAAADVRPVVWVEWRSPWTMRDSPNAYHPKIQNTMYASTASSGTPTTTAISARWFLPTTLPDVRTYQVRSLERRKTGEAHDKGTNQTESYKWPIPL